MKVAFVSPWPPQHSGIADNVYDLVSFLKRFFLIDVITNAINPIALDGVNIIHYQNEKLDLKNYDIIIYEMGNNYKFHGYMLHLILKYKGIVHLHDLVLQHLIAAQSLNIGEDVYYKTLEKWYGEKVKDLVKLLKQKYNINFWETSEVLQLPLFEEVLEHSNFCLVHSEHSKKAIEDIFPNIYVGKVELFHFQNMKFKDTCCESEVFQIGIFGGVQKNRQIKLIIETLKNITDTPWKLHIVGSIDDDCMYLVDENRLNRNIVFYKRVSDNKFEKILHEMDFCISLRSPTMGETSGVVVRYLQSGIPTIVSDVWWYKELPDFVRKVPLEDEEENLKLSLLEFMNKERLIIIKQEMKKFLGEEFNNKIISEKYIIEIINYAIKNQIKFENEILNQLFQKMSATQINEKSFFVHKILNKLKHLI